jgi:hypothetical protein
VDDVRNFYLIGELRIASDGVELFSPPVWPETADRGRAVANVSLLDFFAEMDRILNQLGRSESSSDTYYFVDLDYAISFERHGAPIQVRGTLLMGSQPSTEPLAVDLDELARAVACAAKRLSETLFDREPRLRDYSILDELLSPLNRLAAQCR